jgi:hypothetical protein
MRLLPKRYAVVTASIDPTLGERGAVYAACGFVYCGIMRPGGRAQISLDGQSISERTARRLFGTASAPELSRMGFTAQTIERKARVFAFRGTRREKKELRAAIESLVRPYPAH